MSIDSDTTVDTKKSKKNAEKASSTTGDAAIGTREASFIRAVYEYSLVVAIGETRAEYRVHKIVVGVDTDYEIYRVTASKMMPIGTFKTKHGMVSESMASNPKFKALCASVATAFCDSSDTRTRGEKLADKNNPEVALQRRLEARGQKTIASALGENAADEDADHG